MEKENKEIIENTELKGNNTKGKEQPDKKNNKKKILLITLGIILVLCLGIFIFIRINTTEKHVYEEVENLGEREGVCFDNLLLSSMIYIYNNNGEEEINYLCIFNNGDVYCFEWLEQSAWNIYYHGHEKEDYYRNYEEENNQEGYDDTNWSKMENVVYLGNLSNWETYCLNRYIQNYDVGGEYYNIADTYPMEFPDSNGENYQNQEQLGEEGIWRSYSVRIYWHEQPKHNMRKDEIIESCNVNYISNGIYEKGELRMKAYDENAIAALELFESSEFYDRWVAMCLNNG